MLSKHLKLCWVWEEWYVHLYAIINVQHQYRGKWENSKGPGWLYTIMARFIDKSTITFFNYLRILKKQNKKKKLCSYYCEFRTD